MAGSRAIPTAAALIGAYVVLRTGGKIIGAAVSARAVGISWRQGRRFGTALLPQAGVALGMALAAADRFPQHAAEIVGVAVVSTVLFRVGRPDRRREAVPRLERS